MEARIVRIALAVLLLCASMGASHQTANFTCNAPTRDVAVKVCEAAERYRRELAIDWTGRELPKWSKPCPITVQVGERLGAGGATSFVFDHGQVFGWQMTIQGSLERVLDSVLPHEVTHTIFASHFRQPLPRWADEGACTTVEHASERSKQQKMLVEFLQTGRGIPFSAMFAMKEYPADVLPLYAQGHSLASYLLAQGGKQKYLKFVGDGMQSGDWAAVLNDHYGIRSLGVLQNTWLDWVAQGSPALPEVATVAALQPAAAPQVAVAPAVTDLASYEPPASASKSAWQNKRPRPQPNLVHHGDVPGAETLADSGRPAPIGPGTMVPIVIGEVAGDPFAATLSGGSIQGGASRPQAPETPRQMIIEWSQQPSGPPSFTGPVYDASAGSGALRR